MVSSNFQYTFSTSKNCSEVFAHIINPKNWWMGLFNETIEGRSVEINDEFIFKAGDGDHFSNQKLIECIPDRKIVWLVNDSNLSFLKNSSEWTGTKICFEIFPYGLETKIIFSHIGLIPEIECYDACSSAWLQYLQNLEKYFN